MTSCPSCEKPVRAYGSTWKCDYCGWPHTEKQKQEAPPPSFLTSSKGPSKCGRKKPLGLKAIDRRKTLPPISELPEPWRSSACNQHSRILAKRRRQGRPLRNWEIPLIEGVAKRLGRMTPEELSAQGKRMFHQRGGYAVQRKYRSENRDPLARARHTLKIYPCT
jgi:hypothetical protein